MDGMLHLYLKKFGLKMKEINYESGNTTDQN